MVGPYLERGLAEEAARSLTARYGYKPWILTVAELADTTSETGASDGAGEYEGAGAAEEAKAEGG
jgi:hypothetical protein